MPKIKTRKSVSKRVAKISGTGKLLRRKKVAQHLVKRKSTRTVKTSGEIIEFTKSASKKLSKLIPYRKK
jgi:ribosomal protein L35